MTSRYDFTSEWLIHAPSAACADAVDGLLEGEAWWSGVRLRGDASLAPGVAIQMPVKSPFGYRLRVSARVDQYLRGEYLSATAVGDLAGAGQMWLHEEHRATRITIHWTVSPTAHLDACRVSDRAAPVPSRTQRRDASWRGRPAAAHGVRIAPRIVIGSTLGCFGNQPMRGWRNR